MRNARFLPIFILATIKLAYADAPIDPSFGPNGDPYIYYVGASDAENVSVAQDSRGHLISAGRRSGSVLEMFAARHRPASPISLDGSFGPASNGLANNPFGSFNNNGAVAVAVDHSDRIVVGGYFQLPRSCGSDPNHFITYFAAARYVNDGSAQDGYSDTSFGSSGLPGAVGVMVGDCNLTYGPTSMAIGRHDEVYLGGHDSNGAMAVVKWDATGRLDSSFGMGGIATQSFGGIETAIQSIATDSEGRILVAALVLTRPAESAGVFRFDSTGHLDASFANDGVAIIPDVMNVCCIAVDSKDRIVVAGASSTPDTEQIFLARYDSSGKPDLKFGISGFAQANVGGMSSYASGLTIDSFDRPIVVGDSADFSFYSSSTLVHFNLDGSLNSAVGMRGIYSTPFGLYSSFGSDILIDSANRPIMSVVAQDRLGDIPVLIRYDELFGEGFD